MPLAAAARTPHLLPGRPWTWALALLCAAPLAAAGPPALPAQAATVQAFVPAGWQVEQQQSVDLNHDGRRETVLLLRAGAPADAPVGPGAGLSPARLLAVLKPQRGGWRLVGANARLVPQLDLATQEDPLANGELAAGRGSFSLALGLTATAGSYVSAVLRYRFRLEPGCVRLIGHDRLQTHRATLDTQDTSINFLTGAVLHTTGNAQTDTSSQRRARLAPNPRRCLPDLDSAVSFQPLGAPR